MFKWERRLVEMIDKKLPVLALLVITLCTFYIRRAGYWHISFDYESHFYPALPTYLHTPFYTLLIKMLPDISVAPVRQVKIAVCLFDFITALGAVQLLRKMKGYKDSTALLACYTLLLVSPLTIESGLLWIHLDSICMSAFLWALILYQQKHPVLAGILLGAGAGLLTQYTVLLLLPVLYEAVKVQKKPTAGGADISQKYPPSKAFVFLSAGMITAVFLTVISIGILGLSLRNSLFMLINWLVINPESGAVFSGLLSWFRAMSAYFGYMIGTLVLILAFLKPKYRVPAAIIHFLLLLYIGNILQYGW